jgi:rhamnosyltransferase
LIEFDPKHSREVVDTDFLISSGCLIPVNVLCDIGMMDESLFIDYVDTEWGLRAKLHGYRLLGASGNLMRHRIGETSRRVWLGRWRQVAVHKSFRYYYIFRNCLILLHRPSAFKWRLFHIKRIVMLFFFIVWSLEGTANVRYACAGMRDALAGRTGPMPGT